MPRPGRPAPSPRTRLGAAGEDAARRYLEAHGLRTLARNVRTPYGEIDIVAEDDAGSTLVVVEVKTRGGPGFGPPAEAVTAEKRRRLVRAALHFLGEHHLDDRPVRFDVVALERAGSAGAGGGSTSSRP